MSESSADTTSGESGETEAEQPEVFANRAARRAKGKKSGGAPQATGTAGRAGGRGTVQSPRQYGNRRSG